MRQLRVCALVFAFILGMLPVAALANMAAPWQPGDPVGEPSGPLRRISVQNEQLDFDLRPLAASGPAQVAASYAVVNSGPAADVDLLFVAPGLEQGAVRLDGVPVAATPARGAPLPPNWQAPSTTPDPDGGDLAYHVQPGSGLRFRATIPSGQHHLAVTYDLRPSEYHGGQAMYRAFQVGYVLSPARDWASFGTLDVQVHVPAGWQASTSLPMQRSGDVLHATFEGLPADTLGLTVRHPDDALSLGWLLPLGALLAGGAAVWAIGRWLWAWTRRHGWGAARRLPLALAYLVLASLGLGILGLLGAAGWLALIPDTQVSRGWAYGAAFLTLGFLLLGLVVGGLVGLAALLVRFRSAPAPAPVPARDNEPVAVA